MSEISKSASRDLPATAAVAAVDGAPMKKLLLACAASLALTGMAHGADFPAPVYKAAPPPAADPWTGFYLGVEGGVARHDAFFNNLDLGIIGTFSTTQTGGFGGGYAGYNWQDRSLVVGLEADINAFLSIKATEAWLGDLGPASITVPQSQDVPWLATFRARMGLDFESTLFYFTAGLAVGKVQNSFDINCPAAGCGGLPLAPGSTIATFSEDTTRLGWTAGAGVEHMLTSHWTIRAEFRYVDLGKRSVTCSSTLTGSACVLVNNNNRAILFVPNQSSEPLRGEFSNVLTSAMLGVGYKF
jgi:outer membrane immunogenic protein